jgi:hypothetical protein
LKNKLEEDEVTGQVERAKGPGGEPFSHGGKEPLPGAIVEGFVDKGNAKVFGWKGATCEAQDVGDMKLNRIGVLKKKSWDFSWLMSIPEAAQKV